MKNRPIVAAGALAGCLAALSAGCATQNPEDKLAMVRLQNDVAGLEQELASLRGRVEAVEVTQERLTADVRELGGQAAGETEAMRKRLAEVQQSVAQIDAARERDKKEVVSKLSDKIVEVVDRQRPVVVSGGEHVVQGGDTLSGIASRYGVRPDDIMKANGLTNPNLIKVGQKLVIPR